MRSRVFGPKRAAGRDARSGLIVRRTARGRRPNTDNGRKLRPHRTNYDATRDNDSILQRRVARAGGEDAERDRAGNGSMGHGSVGQMGHFFRWVTWVMGHVVFTHDPPTSDELSTSQ